MSSSFDNLARSLATPMPRRQALKTIGAAFVVAALPAALRPGRAAAHAGQAMGCPGMSFCKAPNIPCCVAVPNGYHLGGCCGPKGKCCIGTGQDGLPASWCCPDTNYTCGKWATADQCSCTTKCNDGGCCPRSKGRCVNGTCCPAIRTTTRPGSNGKGVACCPAGTIAVPGGVGLCCPKGKTHCCDNYDTRVSSGDDDLARLGVKKGHLCVKGSVRKQ